MDISKRNLDNGDIQKRLADAWLNIAVDDNKLINPLEWPKEFDETPEKYLGWVLTRPEYFSFICQEILGVQISPTQALMLKEMWRRRFPMLIASRGYGKSFMLGVYALLRILLMRSRKVMLAGAVFRQSKVIFEYMESIYYNAPVLRDAIDRKDPIRHDTDLYRFTIGDSVCTAIPLGDGSKIRGQRANDLIVDEFSCLVSDTLVQTDRGLVKIKDYLNGEAYSLLNIESDFEYPDTIFRTPMTDVYKVTTDGGYNFSCSNIHKFMAVDGWTSLQDAENKMWIQLDCNDYFPDEQISKNEILIDEKMGWLIGAMIAEGTNTNRNFISLTSTDERFINDCKSCLPNHDWKVYYRKPYKDGRGWNCKASYEVKLHDTKLRETLYNLGVDYVTSHNKTIPRCILQSPRAVVVEFLRGLFDGDGSCFCYKEGSGKNRVGVSYYSVSEDLIDELHTLLLKFGIFGSKVNRASKISKNKQWMLSFRGKYAKKIYDLLKVERFKDNIDKSEYHEYTPTISVITKKTTRYNLSTTRMNKNIHIGSYGSREEALDAFEEYEKEPKIFVRIRSIEKLNKKQVLYDFHLPKTHSFIGNGFVQHNSVPQAIFENVLAGFAAVKSHPIEHVKKYAADKLAKELGIYKESDQDDDPIMKDNQIIVSGTAYYDFNHFSKYWKDWHEIICSKGNPQVLAEYFRRKANDQNREDVEIPDGFNWEDYSIIRIPFELIQKGFMDDAQIARSRATIHSGIYMMEYGAVFTTDSNGFFSRKLIESCVASPNNPIIHASCGEIFFEASLNGNTQKKYVYGIDPASEIDNFSIVVIELCGDHRRIVYGWTTNRAQHIEIVKAGLVNELDYYSYCAKKIRWLMNRFPCERIMMDSQGGGIPVMEALHDPDKFDAEQGELPIWPVTDPEKPQLSDANSGLHIVELVNFASATWTEEANHGMRKDLEDKVLLFPYFDAITVANASIKDDLSKVSYDTLEDCVMDIEELKDELSNIIITQTTSGRDKWDTPEVKLPGGKKGRIRKDRYSALVMANMGARELMRAPTPLEYDTHGGFAGRVEYDSGSMYAGDERFDQWAMEFYAK